MICTKRMNDLDNKSQRVIKQSYATNMNDLDNKSERIRFEQQILTI